jgi:hypothetical protein
MLPYGKMLPDMSPCLPSFSMKEEDAMDDISALRSTFFP